jgi:hypothetical protein
LHLDGDAEFRSRGAQVPERLLHARPELSWGALEFANSAGQQPGILFTP